MRSAAGIAQQQEKSRRQNLALTPEDKARRAARRQELRASNPGKYKVLEQAQNKKRWAQRAPGYARELYLNWAYKITCAEYELLLSQQNGCCAICAAVTPGYGRANFSVDHCHTTGVVRGLLCTQCNVGLGHFRDNPGHLRQALYYLEDRPVIQVIT